MDKNGNITISYDSWKDGIRQHPTVGIGDIVNIDIFSKPGIATIDYKPTEVIGEEDVTDNDTDAIQCCVINSDGDAYFGTDEGDALRLLDGPTYTVTEYAGSEVGNFQTAVFWKDYVIFADYSTSLPHIDLTSFQIPISGDGFEYGFESMPNSSLTSGRGDFRFSQGDIIVGIDDLVYVSSGRYVGSLFEKVGQTFDPTDTGTYTWNNEALDLPSSLKIDAFASYNDFLLISAGNPKTREQSLYPWDRLSETFNYPTPLNNGVSATMTVKDNLLYFLDGVKGRVSVTNRSTVEKVSELDNIEFEGLGDGLAQGPKTMTTIDDIIHFGVSNDDENAAFPIGVYKLKDGAYTRTTLSEELDGSDKEIRIWFVEAFEYNRFLVGWQNVTDGTFGVDLFGKSDYRFDSYKSYIESPLYQIGGSIDKRSYQQLEISLAKELSEGQGVRVSYRKDLNDDWTVITTFDYDTYGAIAQRNTTAKITDVTTLQVKVELTTGADSTTTPELIAVKLF